MTRNKSPLQLDRLYNRDCIEGMADIPEASVDLAFADPPFNIGYKYDVYDDRLAAEEYENWTRKWGAALLRTLKPTGTFWLAIGDDFAAELKRIFQRELGLCCRSWVIWYYTFGVNCKYKFSRSHTHLFHFVRDPKNFTFNRDAIRVPSARQLVYGDSRADSRGRLPDDTWILRPQDAPESFKPGEDTWFVPRVCGTFKERVKWHGCQMPELLLGRIIKACSNPGEMVLDPFGGSGTTLAVAKKLDRHFIGFELSKKYSDRIQVRLNQAKAGDSLVAINNPAIVAPPTVLGKRKKELPSVRTSRRVDAQSSKPDIDPGIVEAFSTARNGFPVDRIIADPEMNAAFAGVCARLGLPGTVTTWNCRLMNLRKMGRLKGLPDSNRTVVEYEQREFDRYKFACEIAIQRFEQDLGTSLDRILCDPDLAGRFDEYVLSMLPDKPSSLKIRWFALRLRKRAKEISAASAELSSPVPMSNELARPFDIRPSEIPAEPGIYWLSADSHHLYVGETENLRERIEVQFGGRRKFDFWKHSPDKLSICIRNDTTIPIKQLPWHQSRWISKWRPIGNYKRLATRQ